jgi:hypothetical protein
LRRRTGPTKTPESTISAKGEERGREEGESEEI